MFDREPLRGVLVRQNVVTRTNFEFFFVVRPNERALVPGQTAKIHSISRTFEDRPLVSKGRVRREPNEKTKILIFGCPTGTQTGLDSCFTASAHTFEVRHFRGKTEFSADSPDCAAR